MQKSIAVIFVLLSTFRAFGQRDKTLPWVSRNIYGDSCYVNVKSTITKLTGYQFKIHPLLWVKSEIESNLLKTDTTYNDTLQRRTIYYYAKKGHLIQIVTSSTEAGNKEEFTKIFDNSNNLIFWETLERNRNTVMRIRRGYDDFNHLVFECVHWETPLSRLTIYPGEGKVVRYRKPVCDCDF